MIRIRVVIEFFVLALIIAALSVACSASKETDFNGGEPSPNSISSSTTDQTVINGLAIKLNLTNLINGSDVIILGQVQQIMSSRLIYVAEFQRELPCTDILIQTSRYLFGDTQSQNIAVQVWGGQIKDVTVHIPDSPIFKPGEQVALFLKRLSSSVSPPPGVTVGDYYTIFGSTQGKFIVDNDNLIDWEGKTLATSDLTAEIASVHGTK